MSSVLDIVRLQFLDRRILLGTALGTVVFVALGVGLSAVDVASQGSFGKGLASGVVGGWYGAIAAVQFTGLVRQLPFAVAMGRSRSSFYLGTLLWFLVQVLFHGVLLSLALAVERATGGWVAGIAFMGTSWADAGNPVGQFFVFAAPFVLTFPMVLLAAVVQVRFGGVGLAVAAVFAGAGAFFVLIGVGLLTVGAPQTVFQSLMLAAIGVLYAVAGWFVVQRAAV